MIWKNLIEKNFQKKLARAIEDEEDDVEYLLKALEIIFGYVYSEETTKKVIENLREMMFKRNILKIFKEIRDGSR